MHDVATITLRYVTRDVDRHGNERFYFRRPGKAKVRLPGQPGSAEFMEAYAAALEDQSRQSAGNAPAAGTLSALIVAYYQSYNFRKLNPRTQYVYRGILDRFRTRFGDGPAKLLKPTHIKDILDKQADRPGATKNLLKALRQAFQYGVERGLVNSNPAAAVTFSTGKTDGFRAWTDDDIEKFREKWPSGTRARLALALLLYTGQRRSDVVRMGRQHVKDGIITVRQQKTGASLDIPIHPELQTEIDLIPAGQMMFLQTAYGKPMSPVGFSNWFSECARDAGLPKKSSPHGLRKAAARQLAEAGCSEREIMAITGHQSAKEVDRYTASARQKVLARAAMGRMGNT